ncbi:hypothetical protein [Sphaerisporangium fuscum]|uniref:hypothetical protein n=1 Tax=Sphaerisporangium fuscum TaxID=2835868 RepID=UPI001BDD8563|nr:hypothetical protein [Sphaerisporangium fuscum]
MTTGHKPKSLFEITKHIGLNMSDVALLSGLDESTVSRLWDNTCWLDRISGRSLQSLMSAVPGIAEYSIEHSISRRRDTLVAELDAEGLTVDVAALESSPVARQHLLNALEAALHIVRNEAAHKVSSYLARFWGREQDRALETLYSTRRGHGLLKDPYKLVDSSVELVPRLNGKSYSFHSILALNILTHQVAKVTGALVVESAPRILGRRKAFMMRGLAMGLLIACDDLDLAERYRRELESTPVYTALEEWSFPTYTRDGRISSDFSLPGSLSLVNTAVEVLREIESYNDAYFHYLVSTYLPLALQRDPAFGSRAADLLAAVERRGADSRDKRIREACAALVKRLKGTG